MSKRLTKEQMGQRIADRFTIPGLSPASAAWMFSQLRINELRLVMAAIGEAPTPKYELCEAAASNGWYVMANTQDNKFWVPVSKLLATKAEAEDLIAKLYERSGQ